jgi:hypothetical protein
MRRGKYLLIGVFTLFLNGLNEVNAQPNTLYFLKGVPQTKDLNPARPGIESGFYISLPLLSKIDLSANTNNWSFNDLIHRGTGLKADSMVWDFKKYLGALGKNNFLMESAAWTLFEMGYKKEDIFYAFSWTEREYAEPFFSKSLAELLYYGNEPYLGSVYQSGYFGLGAAHYREFAFTYARELKKGIGIGITGKLLFGLAGAKTSGLNFIMGMPIDGNQIDVGATGKALFSAPVDIQLLNNPNGYQAIAKNNFGTGSYLANFGNPGLAVDLGFTNKISKKLELSVSLIDLGFISWTKDVIAFTENGHFIVRGINLNTPTSTNNPPTTTDVQGLFLAFRDSLRTAFYPNQNTKTFSTVLPVKLYVAGEYKMSEQVTFGGLGRVRMFNNMIHTSLTASVNARLSNKLSMSASYSVMESTYDNLGFAAAYRIGAVQIYAAADNVPSFFEPTTARNTNLRVGINLIFNDEVKSRKGVYNRRPKRAGPGCPLVRDNL